MSSNSSDQPKLKVGILGATGTVGQRFVVLLASHPYFVLHALCASSRSAGKSYRAATKWKLATPMPSSVADQVVDSCSVTKESRLLECDVVFSGLDASVAGSIEAACAAAGLAVFSNAKNFRMHPNVPLVVPTANAEHLAPLIAAQRAQGAQMWVQELLREAPDGHAADYIDPELFVDGGCIVTNSNCSTTGLVVVLRALQAVFGPATKVHVTTMQAVSGAGYPGLPVLDVFDNVVPLISGEEEKLETEPRKILGSVEGARVADAELLVAAACNRVPVLDGHTLAVSVSFRDSAKVEPEAAMEALRAYVPPPGEEVWARCPSFPHGVGAIRVAEEPDRPQPRLDRERGKGMTVSVGRVRKCNLFDLKFVALTHNTILGAAGSSILNAEIAVAQGLIKGSK
ncbi:hypothetical protein GGF31_007634 [Allomyces arbusculus]|nr:hypothetical protein GGF31_007634 [Allomyces arbusculus]